MTFKANTQISEPAEDTFNLEKRMGGFGFDPDQGLFIPVDEKIDYTGEPPIPKAMLREL